MGNIWSILKKKARIIKIVKNNFLKMGVQDELFINACIDDQIEIVKRLVLEEGANIYDLIYGYVSKIFSFSFFF